MDAAAAWATNGEVLAMEFSADTFNCVKADDAVILAAAACKTKGDVDI